MDWTDRVIKANGKTHTSQIKAVTIDLRHELPSATRSIMSPTRGRTTAAGLHSMAQVTNTAEAASRARDLAGARSLSCRDKVRTFNAARAKQPLLRPRSSEIQLTLSTCSGC